MEIRQIQIQDIPAVCALVKEVFDQVLASTYTEEGRQTFSAFIEEEAMRRRLSDNGFGLVAFVDGNLASQIEVRNNSHICLLFTKCEHQGKGLAKVLVEQAVLLCKTHDSSVAAISVNAALSAIHAYQHFGFKQCAPEQERDGIRFVPMIRLL
ncbi:MAG: GNAT family N-acetyltransferase [Spirochaetales bacterium]|jgi:GNAT superfamily N-acetyltransferase|nr:GNAT family N-acetyltransferase [Spirochaetales bacterium]